MLNIVLVRPKPGILENLPEFISKAKQRFPADEPHVFLFSESHFDQFGVTNVKPHFKGKKIVQDIRSALKGTNWHLAFSVLETTLNGLSNTGYVVHGDGQSALPKREWALGDRRNVIKYAKSIKSRWKEQREKWFDRSGRNESKPFQQIVSDGKRLEFRICLDASVPDQEQVQNPITLVSANGLKALDLLPLKGRTIIVNDHSRGFSLHLDQRIRKFEQSALNSINKKLTTNGVQLHVY